MTKPVTTSDQRKQAMKDRIRPRLEHFIVRAENAGELRRARSYRWVLDELVHNDNPDAFKSVHEILRWPVTIEEFCEGKEFLGVLDDFRVWPSWEGELRKMCPDVICGESPVHEVVLGGASGTGKTTIAWIITAYQIYLLTCFRTPHAIFPGLSTLTPIVFPMMSLKESLTRKVIYEPFRTLFLSMPYVKRYLSWDKYKDSELVFSNGIQVVPGLAMDTTMQGQGVCGGILDEMSFMEVIDQSVRVPGPRGQGGRFDQAELVHRAAINRRNRSFTTRGISIGTICVLSNTRYQGDFLDRRLKELENRNQPNVYYRRLKRPKLHPEDIAAVRRKDVIRVLVGTEQYQTRVLKEDESVGDNTHVEVVPKKYEYQFLDDAESALREVCGISTGVIRPFIPQRDKIAGAFRRGEGLRPMVDKQDVDLAYRDLPEWMASRMPQDKNIPRFLHIDLSKSHDRCGVAVVKVAGYEFVSTPKDPKLLEEAPHFVVELAVTIKPSGENQIDPFEIRTWLMRFSTEHGFEIGGVSYDGYQSQESIARWRKAGTKVRELSVDRTSEPYGYLKKCLIQDRVDFVGSTILKEELLELEHNAEKDKVDHPPKGSKDLADAVAGAIYNASISRGIRRAGGYVDDAGDRVRIREKGSRPQGRDRQGGRRTRRVNLKVRMLHILRGEQDPWQI